MTTQSPYHPSVFADCGDAAVCGRSSEAAATRKEAHVIAHRFDTCHIDGSGTSGGAACDEALVETTSIAPKFVVDAIIYAKAAARGSRRYGACADELFGDTGLRDVGSIVGRVGAPMAIQTERQTSSQTWMK
jgi:hypothetical protein